MQLHLTAVRCHLPYQITQYYLPPDANEHTPHEPTLDRPVLNLPTQAEWFTSPPVLTHPSTNPAVHNRELNSQLVHSNSQFESIRFGFPKNRIVQFNQYLTTLSVFSMPDNTLNISFIHHYTLL